MNTHKDRGEGFNDLIDLFVATSQTGSIPYLEKKVHVLLTGSYKDCTVFANGNQWLPEKKMAAIFKTLLGEEVNLLYFYLTNTLWSYHYGNLGLVTHSGVIVKLPSNKG